MGSTRPVRVISPVMATSLRTGRPERAETTRWPWRRRPTGRPWARRRPARGCAAPDLEGPFVDAEPVGVGLGEGQRGAGRLLHHVTELTGQDQGVLPLGGAGLHEHDVAAHGRVVHAGGDADGVRLGGLLRVDPGPAQHGLDVVGADLHPLGLVAGDPAGGLAGELAQLPLELADPGLPGVLADDAADRVVLDDQVLLPARSPRAGGGAGSAWRSPASPAPCSR
jgi:hypothetical protein